MDDLKLRVAPIRGIARGQQPAAIPRLAKRGGSVRETLTAAVGGRSLATHDNSGYRRGKAWQGRVGLSSGATS
jgi:hypothetical protein